MKKLEEEVADTTHNRVIKTGLLLQIQYLIECKLNLTKLGPEEWFELNGKGAEISGSGEDE